MKNLKRNAQKGFVMMAGLGASIAANAADYTTQITAAQAEGEANVSASTLAVIGIAVVGFGVAAVVSWIKR